MGASFGFGANYSNTVGLTYATLGAGNLNVRDRPLLDISTLNRVPTSMQRVIRREGWSFQIPTFNWLELNTTLQGASRYINALTANIPNEVREAGDRQRRHYENMILRGATPEEMQRFVASGEFDRSVRARQAIESARRAHFEPSATDLALVLELEGAVFERSGAGEVEIVFDCPTNGTVCRFVLEEFKRLMPTAAKKELLLRQLADGARLITGLGSSGSNRMERDWLGMHFDTMLRCAWDEPAVFREFMSAYPDVLMRYADAVGVDAAGKLGLQRIVDRAMQPGATSAQIRAVYDQELSRVQRFAIGMSVSLVSTRMLAETSADFAWRLAHQDESAYADIRQMQEVAKGLYEYARENPEQVTQEVLNAIETFADNVLTGDPDTYGTLLAEMGSGGFADRALRWASDAGIVAARTALVVQRYASQRVLSALRERAVRELGVGNVPIEDFDDAVARRIADYIANGDAIDGVPAADLRREFDYQRGNSQTPDGGSTGPLVRAYGEAANPSGRTLADIVLDARLPDPVAGLDYTPGNARHLSGFAGELRLANEIANMPDMVVLQYGSRIGTHGADVISVNRVTGEVFLWDSKWRSAYNGLGPSPTFREGSETLTRAIKEARDLVEANSSRFAGGAYDRAMSQFDSQTLHLRTVSTGNARNSVLGN